MDFSKYNDKTDYYELFGVSESATQSDLKKAYYKLALIFHPDKNKENEAEATRVFQLLEHAYSVLSDPHERQWYDDHRGLNETEDGQLVATKVDMFGLFKASSFNGFDDTPRGFYNVFGKAFSELGSEEKIQTPGFGNADSTWEEVEKFYNFWSTFKTTRSFAFKDIYEPRYANNSNMRRGINRENMKERQKAEKEFVKTLRELVAFVRKRDPRVAKEIERQNELKAQRRQEEDRKREEKRLRDLEEIERLQRERFKEEPDLLNQMAEEEIEEDPDWYCEFCSRSMDNENVFKQHCGTKKHKKASANARKDFLANPSSRPHTAYYFLLLGLDQNEINNIDPDVDMLNIISPLVEKKKIKELKKKGIRVNKMKHEEEEEEIDTIISRKKNKKKDKSQKNNEKNNKKNTKNKNQSQEEEEEEMEDRKDEVKKILSNKEKRKLQMKEKRLKKELEEKQREEELKKLAPSKSDEYYSDNEEEDKQGPANEDDQQKGETDTKEVDPADATDNKGDDNENKGEVGEEVEENADKNEEEEEVNEWKKKKEEMKLSKAKEREEKNKKKGKNQKKDKGNNNKTQPDQPIKSKSGKCPEGMFMCRRCWLLFPSKRKLFNHLDESGHAQAI